MLRQSGDRLVPALRLLAVEHLDRPGVHRTALKRHVEIRRRPGDPLGDVGEVGCLAHDARLELHVAPDVRLGRADDRDVSVLLEALLQLLELDQLGRHAGRAAAAFSAARAERLGRRDFRLGVLVEVPAPSVVVPEERPDRR